MQPTFDFRYCFSFSMIAVHITITADHSSLARMDRSTFSQQTLMELFVAGIDPIDRDKFMDSDGEFEPIEKWPGVYLNGDGEVTNISWDAVFARQATLDLQGFPPSVKYFDVTDCVLQDVGDWANSNSSDLVALYLKGNSLHGSLELGKLPPMLEILDASENLFSGEVDLAHAPAGLHYLDIQKNLLSGSLRLEHLPRNLIEFSAQNNRFTGSIDLAHLPDSLTEMSLRNNDLSGAIDLRDLPSGMETLYLDANRLSGTLVIESFPTSIRFMHFHDNQFAGDILVGVLPKSLRSLKVDAAAGTDVRGFNGEIRRNLRIVRKQ